MSGEQLESPASDKPHRKPLKRLTNSDRAFALKYAADGLPQTEIAKRLDVNQATISRWLSDCQDTTAEATAYFRGQALPMAQKVVRKGKAADLVKVLQGVSVLEQERSAGLTIQIGIKDSDVSLSLSGPLGESLEKR